MFWLTRPPYLRWAAAAAIVVAAFAWDVRDRAETLYPFAATAIQRGSIITESHVDWRGMPSGTMELPDLSDPVASRDLDKGEPIVPSAIARASVVPHGWWSVSVALPASARPGARVRLIESGTAFDVEGVVVTAAAEDLLSYAATGMVAVPPDAAARVAVAERNGALIVLLDA